MKNLLFLCTGNYYRSRFAEMLFNARVAEIHLNWKADSRGLATELGVGNIGPISPQALKGLTERGITVEKMLRFPLQLQEQELAQADCVIALDEEEHRAYVETRFPKWGDCVEYWHVHDLHLTSAAEALSAIEREVHVLIRRLLDKE